MIKSNIAVIFTKKPCVTFCKQFLTKDISFGLLKKLNNYLLLKKVCGACRACSSRRDEHESEDNLGSRSSGLHQRFGSQTAGLRAATGETPRTHPASELVISI